MTRGYVYVLTNEHMPGLVKIGKTTRSPEQRAGELYQTGVPSPFQIFSAVLVPDCHALEATIHDAFAGDRVDVAREFFTTNPKAASEAIHCARLDQIQEFVMEFDEDLVVHPEYACLDEGDLGMFASRLGVTPWDVARNFHRISEAAIADAIEAEAVCRRVAKLRAVE